MKNRPLFRSDRQPYREPVAGAVPARNFDAELSRLSLIGVLSVGEEMRGVVVGKGGAGSTRAERWEVKAGDDLPGFKVKEVRTDGLAVTAEGREFLLPLYAGAPAAGTAARTEAPRRETAPSQPASAQPAAPAPVQPPRPAAAAPAAQPPATNIPVPGVAPRYIPGRR